MLYCNARVLCCVLVQRVVCALSMIVLSFVIVWMAARSSRGRIRFPEGLVPVRLVVVVLLLFRALRAGGGFLYVKYLVVCVSL